MRFASGAFTPTTGVDPSLLSNLATLRASERPSTYGFLLLNVLLSERVVQQLEGYGVSVLGPHESFHKVELPLDEASLTGAVDLPEVEWIGYSLPDQKLDDALRALLRPEVDEGTADDLPVIVFLFDDDTDGSFRLALESAGAVVGDWDTDLQAYMVAAPPAGLDAIARLDFVVHVELMRPMTIAHDNSMPYVGADFIRPPGSGRFGGESVSIGIMDSGAAQHADLNKFMCGVDFTSERSAWRDDNGHGTHVLGTMIGTGRVNRRYTGAAPGVGDPNDKIRIRVAKVFTARGTGPNSATLRAPDWLDDAENLCRTKNHTRPHIVNYSGGSTSSGYGTDSVSLKFDAKVWGYGQLYVAAAGNEGPGRGTIIAPAVGKNVLAVGSVNDSNPSIGLLASYSSQGPTADDRKKPNVAAPGNTITSTDSGNTRGYADLTGTSMASPHVAGIAATLLDHYSEFKWRPYLTRAVLTATTLGHRHRGTERNRYGAGVVSSYLAHWASPNSSGWTTHWSWGESQARGGVAYRDITVPSGARQLVVVMTWDEPSCCAGATKAVAYDLDLYVDRILSDDVSCGSDCGEFFSISSIDNVEYVVINNPRPATYRIKTYSYAVPLSFRLKVGMAAIVVRGSTSPTLNVTTSSSTPEPGLGSTFNVTTRVSPSTWVADGVTQHVASVPSGLRLVSLSTPRWDGLTVGFDPSAGVVLGSIPHSGFRTAVWTFQAIRRGVKTIPFVTRANNGTARRVDVRVNVGGNVTFTDPIVAGVTPVKAVHFAELRQRIDEARMTHGLGPFNWTGGTGGGSRVRAVHLTQMRTALNQAYDRAGRRRPTYSDSVVRPGRTVIRARHVMEMRAAIVALLQ